MNSSSQPDRVFRVDHFKSSAIETSRFVASFKAALDLSRDPPRVTRSCTLRRRRKRKVTLASVAKQAAKAGVDVARYEFSTDGTISVVLKPATSPEVRTSDDDDPNPWDEVARQ